MTLPFQFEAVAKTLVPLKDQVETDPDTKVGVWTDGVLISHDSEPFWAPAFRFELGKRYRITVEVIG